MVQQKENILEVKNLKKFFPIHRGFLKTVVGHVRAVDDISFDIKTGETYGLVGESGCGKTTTSRLILKAYTPTSGEINFKTSDEGTVDVGKANNRTMRTIRREMQMIFQDPFTSLNPRMTLLNIVGEPMVVNGVGSVTERRDRVGELLKVVGLRPEYMNRFPHAFSGGERQRIGIARALALNPRLVVADEPVSSLDVSVQAQVLNLLMELQEELKLTYIFVAHDLSVVRHIADRVAVMYVGKLAETGPTEEIFENPKHPYSAALLSAVPIPDPRTKTNREPLKGEVANPASPPSGCYFQPRCAYATEICRTTAPKLEKVSPTRTVLCHRWKELDLSGIGGTKASQNGKK